MKVKTHICEREKDKIRIKMKKRVTKRKLVLEKENKRRV